MRKTLPCPNCQSEIPAQGLSRKISARQLCQNCHAPIRFRQIPELAAYLAAVASMMLAMWTLSPYLEDLTDHLPNGKLDRSSLKNLAILFPFMALAAYVQNLVATRFGSLVLANKNWPLKLTHEQRKLMRSFDISHNGEYFAHGEMHFDRLEDAIAYSQQVRRGNRA